ncbi:hypothetical protein K438DRAFT_1784885 [Mycena galopus ATCC 62051]|nr:hypothetical protein K438DRAFT_1784885 [Mycena galopus ATCC 62051]
MSPAVPAEKLHPARFLFIHNRVADSYQTTDKKGRLSWKTGRNEGGENLEEISSLEGPDEVVLKHKCALGKWVGAEGQDLGQADKRRKLESEKVGAGSQRLEELSDNQHARGLTFAAHGPSGRVASSNDIAVTEIKSYDNVKDLAVRNYNSTKFKISQDFRLAVYC